MWMNLPTGYPCVIGPNGEFLNESPGPLPAEVEIQTSVRLIAHDRATGAPLPNVPIQDYCVAPGEAPVPPPPPSPQQVWDAVPLPTPSVNRNPAGEGLVGLDTWLWSDPEAPISISLVLDGWNLTVTAHPTTYAWEISDGARYTASEPGTEANPAATHVFNFGGGHGIVHTVTWSGSYTFSGYGIADGATLGTVTQQASDTIDVREVQAVIR